MYLVASVRLSVRRLKVKGQSHISGAQRSILGARLCRVQQRAKKVHYQSKSKEESLSVRGFCLCVELSRGYGRSAFNTSMEHWAFLLDFEKMIY